MKKVLVIIPTYNEKENITKIVPEVLSLHSEIDILIVDDNSPDGTGHIAEQFEKETPRVHIMHRPSKMGMGKAYRDGFQWALAREYQYICEMDADFSHEPRDLKRILQEVKDCDLCIGSRYVENAGVVNWPIWREILSRMANVYVRWVTGIPLLDSTAGFKCFRRNVLEAIDVQSICSEGYAFQIEVHYRTWRKKFRIREIPIIFKDRSHGRSKMSERIIFEAFFTYLCA